MVGFFLYFGSPRQKGVLGADAQGFTVWRLWKDTFFRTQLFGLQQFIVFKSFWRSFSFHSMNAPGLRTRFFFEVLQTSLRSSVQPILRPCPKWLLWIHLLVTWRILAEGAGSCGSCEPQAVEGSPGCAEDSTCSGWLYSQCWTNESSSASKRYSQHGMLVGKYHIYNIL